MTSIAGKSGIFRGSRRGLSLAFWVILAAGAQSACDPSSPDGADASTNTKTDAMTASGTSTGSASETSSNGSASEQTSGPTSSEQGSDTASTPDAQSCVVGQTRSCSALPSGESINFPGGIPQGACRLGQQSCGPQGTWEACQGAVVPQAADGCEAPLEDANCNGVAYEGCACKVGIDAPRPCGTDVGACQAGVQNCENGVWGNCVGQVAPVKERCNQEGIDEDCDGMSDLADTDCACLDGSAPTACTIEGAQGDCALGKIECVNGHFTSCQPRFPKTTEICGELQRDALGEGTGDEDCDGEIDDANGPQEPVNCTLYMLDIDNDGWGAIGKSYIEAGVQATWGCFCRSPDHDVGHVYFREAESRDRVNADCGDCFERDGKSVFPGQTEYFVEPSICLTQIEWPGGPFDYNCDGAQEKRYTGIHDGACLEETNGEMGCFWEPESVGHWLEGADPACGVSGIVPKCRLSKDSRPDKWSCTKFMRPGYRDTQQCR